MNALLRTAFKYSVKATRQILRTFHLLRRRRGDADEDVVQRRFGHLEEMHPRPRRQRLEQILRIAGAADLLALAEIANQLHTVEAAPRRVPALHAQAHSVGAVTGLDCGKRAIEHLATSVD